MGFFWGGGVMCDWGVCCLDGFDLWFFLFFCRGCVYVVFNMVVLSGVREKGW